MCKTKFPEGKICSCPGECHIPECDFYIPTFAESFLSATKLLGQPSDIFQLHKRITTPIQDCLLLKLHCIAGGIVTEFKIKDDSNTKRRYRMTLEVLDD